MAALEKLLSCSKIYLFDKLGQEKDEGGLQYMQKVKTIIVAETFLDTGNWSFSLCADCSDFAFRPSMNGRSENLSLIFLQILLTRYEY